MRFLDVGVEADEDGGQTDKGVKCCNKLRHLGHLYAVCDEVAENGATRQHQQHDEPVADIRSEDRGDNGKTHACYAVPDGAFGAFLSGKAAEGKDEKNGCGNIGRGNDTNGHKVSPTRLRTSGTWRACAVSRGNRRRC